MKLLMAYGTRPEYIKIKPLLYKLKDKVKFKTLFTGQHKDLVSSVADYTLNISDKENRLDSIVGSLMNQKQIFKDITHVLVQGDTTSAFALALAAFHRELPVIHLEAGLRTYDMKNPYPEEFNRQAISRIAIINFCPTEENKKNLLREKCNGDIYVVGNTVLDNLVGFKPQYTNTIIITLHRKENHILISRFFKIISELSLRNPDLDFILPIHPNPNVQKHKNLLKNIRIVEPVPYNQMTNMLSSCRFIISDSGGIQEEASFLNKKVIVCRKVTERSESLGIHSFLCRSPDELPGIFDKIKNDYKINAPCPYGDGKSTDRIVDILIKEK